MDKIRKVISKSKFAFLVVSAAGCVTACSGPAAGTEEDVGVGEEAVTTGSSINCSDTQKSLWRVQQMNLILAALQQGIPLSNSAFEYDPSYTPPRWRMMDAYRSADAKQSLQGLSLVQMHHERIARSVSTFPDYGTKLWPKPVKVGALCGGKAFPVKWAQAGATAVFYDWKVTFPSTAERDAAFDVLTRFAKGARLPSDSEEYTNEELLPWKIGAYELHFDPVASPDGFSSPAASGSCPTYAATAALSTAESDSRFANTCISDTGQGCEACNLAGETTCSSRVVWRRLGSQWAWRCRAM